MDILSTGPHHSALIHYSSLRGGRERVPRDLHGDGGDRQRPRDQQGGQGVRAEPAARPRVEVRHHGQAGKQKRAAISRTFSSEMSHFTCKMKSRAPLQTIIYLTCMLCRGRPNQNEFHKILIHLNYFRRMNKAGTTRERGTTPMSKSRSRGERRGKTERRAFSSRSSCTSPGWSRTTLQQRATSEERRGEERCALQKWHFMRTPTELICNRDLKLSAMITE